MSGDLEGNVECNFIIEWLRGICDVFVVNGMVSMMCVLFLDFMEMWLATTGANAASDGIRVSE